MLQLSEIFNKESQSTKSLTNKGGEKWWFPSATVEKYINGRLYEVMGRGDPCPSYTNAEHIKRVVAFLSLLPDAVDPYKDEYITVDHLCGVYNPTIPHIWLNKDYRLKRLTPNNSSTVG